jgi:hypothetical protein
MACIGKENCQVCVGVYVDDLVINRASSINIDAFKAKMKDKFKMSDMRLVTKYLGIEVQL